MTNDSGHVARVREEKATLYEPFTSETARAAGKAGKGKPKSLRKIARLVCFKPIKGEDGATRAGRVVDALVTKAEAGDVPAIKALADLVEPPRARHVKHTHGLARSLRLDPAGDARGRIVEASSGEQCPPSSTT